MGRIADGCDAGAVLRAGRKHCGGNPARLPHPSLALPHPTKPGDRPRLRPGAPTPRSQRRHLLPSSFEKCKFAAEAGPFGRLLAKPRMPSAILFRSQFVTTAINPAAWRPCLGMRESLPRSKTLRSSTASRPTIWETSKDLWLPPVR